MKIKLLSPLLLVALLCTQCGVLTALAIENTVEDAINAASQNGNNAALADSAAFVFATDYTSSGQIYSSLLSESTTSLSNSGMLELGSDAIIKYENSLLYILHSGYSLISSDNLQIVDPWDETTPFKTIAQYSTGNGTNPQDVIINGSKAYITLYNPSADSDNVDENGLPGDVIVMDTNDGSILNRFSFYDFLNDDGDRQANARKLALVGNTLYVCLQDLSSDGWFMANSSGKLGMIDTINETIVDAITLQGWNPASLAVSDDRTKIFVSSVNDYSTMSGHAGIEVVNLETQESDTFVLDSELGAYVDNIKATSKMVYAVASTIDWETFTSSSKIISFPQTIETANDVTNFTESGADIRDLALDGNFLWVTTRVISTTEGDDSPVIRVFDTESGNQIGEDLLPTVAGVSIAVVE